MKPTFSKALRVVLMFSVLSATLLASGAADARLRFNAGANYWFDRGGLFNLTLAPSAVITRNFEVGGRFGAFLATSPNTIGVPADIFLRGNFDNFYAEVLAGPWIQFEDSPFMGHAAVGFGLNASAVSVGLELGYLQNNPIAGLQLGFKL